jgi:PIN domain-containing protein
MGSEGPPFRRADLVRTTDVRRYVHAQAHAERRWPGDRACQALRRGPGHGGFPPGRTLPRFSRSATRADRRAAAAASTARDTEGLEMRLLLDLDVVLDVLLDRQPHVAAAASLWAAVEKGWAQGVLAAHSLVAIASLARRRRDPALAREVLADLLAIFEVAPVDRAALCRAASLAAAGCDAIVTREPERFRSLSVSLLDPATAAALSRRRRQHLRTSRFRPGPPRFAATTSAGTSRRPAPPPRHPPSHTRG